MSSTLTSRQQFLASKVALAVKCIGGNEEFLAYNVLLYLSNPWKTEQGYREAGTS